MKALVILILALASVSVQANILCEWDAPATTNRVDGYRLYFKPGGLPYEMIEVKAPATSVNLVWEEGATYTAYVTAFNAGGESPPSEKVVFTVPITPVVSDPEPTDDGVLPPEKPPTGITITVTVRVETE